MDHQNIIVGFDKVATSSKRPAEYIEKEEHEVRRRSSVNPRALELATKHRRFSQIDQSTLDSYDEKPGFSHNHKEDV